MKILLDAIRSIFFNLSYYLFTIVYCTLVLPVVLAKTERPTRKAIHIYCKGSLFLARYIMGITVEYRGLDHFPKTGGLILAAAHQSYMDPILTYIVRQDVTALAKKQLFSLPLIGQLISRIGVIKVDRESGRAHKGMNDVGARVKKEGRAIIIYPQATRVPIGQSKPLKAGAFHIHQASGLDVYPVATNTGAFWTKGFWHRSGHVIFDIKPKLEHGLNKDVFMKQIQRDVVNASDALVREVGYGTLLTSANAE